MLPTLKRALLDLPLMACLFLMLCQLPSFADPDGRDPHVTAFQSVSSYYLGGKIQNKIVTYQRPLTLAALQVLDSPAMPKFFTLRRVSNIHTLGARTTVTEKYTWDDTNHIFNVTSSHGKSTATATIGPGNQISMVEHGKRVFGGSYTNRYVGQITGNRMAGTHTGQDKWVTYDGTWEAWW